MNTFLAIGKFKAIRASASGGDGETILRIGASNMEGDCVSIALGLDLGAEGLRLARAVAETINSHPGNGGFPVNAPGWHDNSQKEA